MELPDEPQAIRTADLRQVIVHYDAMKEVRRLIQPVKQTPAIRNHLDVQLRIIQQNASQLHRSNTIFRQNELNHIAVPLHD